MRASLVLVAMFWGMPHGLAATPVNPEMTTSEIRATFDEFSARFDRLNPRRVVVTGRLFQDCVTPAGRLQIGPEYNPTIHAGFRFLDPDGLVRLCMEKHHFQGDICDSAHPCVTFYNNAVTLNPQESLCLKVSHGDGKHEDFDPALCYLGAPKDQKPPPLGQEKSEEFVCNDAKGNLFARRPSDSQVLTAITGQAVKDLTGTLWAVHYYAANSDEKCTSKEQTDQAIYTAYQAKVRPIFAKKCFACHDPRVPPPAYAIGGSWNPVNQDIAEGQKAINLGTEYPFYAEGTNQTSLLHSIRSAISGASMPPKKYTVIHWDSKITATDRTSILDWVSDSLDRLACVDKLAEAKAEAADPVPAPAVSPQPGANAPPPPPKPKPNPGKKLAKAARKVIEDSCTGCHKPTDKKVPGIADLKRLVEGKSPKDGARFIVPGKPAESKLYQLIEKDEMPQDDPLSPADKKAIFDWIKAGAPTD